MSLRVVPVLDLKAGRAVHAIGGDRAHYQPLRSVLHAAPDPIGLARALRERLGRRALYLADLDAIAGAAPDLRLYRNLHDVGLTLWVDPGVRDESALPPLLDAGIGTIIVGLETVRGPGALERIVHRAGGDRVVFSLDLKAGRPLIAEGADWGTVEPRSLADRALGLGVQRLLLLDLARVGTGRGIATLPLLQDLTDAYPGLEITVGGGIAGPEDLAQLAQTKAAAVLVGSALHDGRIGRDQLWEENDPQMNADKRR